MLHRADSFVSSFKFFCTVLLMFGLQSNLFCDECSSTFSKTAFALGMTKSLQPNGLSKLVTREGQVLLSDCQRIEVLDFESSTIVFRDASGKDGLMNFEGSRLLEDKDEIWLIDGPKRIFAFREQDRYGVVIFSDLYLKDKIKSRQPTSSPILVYVEKLKNLFDDESILRHRDDYGSEQEQLPVVVKFKREELNVASARYSSVSFYSKSAGGKLYNLSKLASKTLFVDLIVVHSPDGYVGVFDAYGNVIIPIKYGFDDVQVISKNSMIGYKGDESFQIYVGGSYVDFTSDKTGSVKQIRFNLKD